MYHQPTQSPGRPAVSPHGGVAVQSATIALQAPLWQQAEAVTPRLEQSSIRNILDVTGAILFVVLVSLCMIRVTQGLFIGGDFASAIGWESVWILACLMCAPLVPSGIRHVISVRTTLHGLLLDWPEMAYATLMLTQALQYGMPAGFFGPLGLAFAVGTAEEFIFRILLLGWLVTRLRTEWALLVSAIVFGVAHLQAPTLIGFLSIMPQFAGGMVLGAMYLRTRNPLGGIIAHAAWDFPIFLAYGAGVSGGGTEAGMPDLMSLMPWIILTIYGLWLIRTGTDVVGREELPATVPRPQT